MENFGFIRVFKEKHGNSQILKNQKIINNWNFDWKEKWNPNRQALDARKSNYLQFPSNRLQLT